MTSTKEARRFATQQSLASSRLEGHVPSPEYLADIERFVDGTMSIEQQIAASLERARVLDARLSADPRLDAAPDVPSGDAA